METIEEKALLAVTEEINLLDELLLKTKNSSEPLNSKIITILQRIRNANCLQDLLNAISKEPLHLFNVSFEKVNDAYSIDSVVLHLYLTDNREQVIHNHFSLSDNPFAPITFEEFLETESRIVYSKIENHKTIVETITPEYFNQTKLHLISDYNIINSYISL